jgi:hypothetical protein
MFLYLVNCLCTNMVIQVLETVTKEQEKNREKSWLCAANTSSVWVHRTVSGAPGWSEVNWPLSGLDGGVQLKITGPFGGAPDCPVSHPRRTRRPREKQRGDVAIIHRTVWWFTGLSGEPTVGRSICGRRVAAPTVGRGHRTVWCAPDSVRCANRPGAATVVCACFGRLSRTGQATVAVRWRTRLSSAPLDRRQGWPSKFASNGS